MDILSRAEALSLCLDADNNLSTSGTANYSESDDASDSSTRYPEDQQERVNGINDASSSWFEEVITIVEEMTNKKVVKVPPQWMPPPSLEGTSCVYVLEVGSPPRYYVGETDSLSKRLVQHRRKGGEWTMLKAAVVGIQGGKSDSRNVESLIIRRMAKAGYDMVSIADGRLVRKASSDEFQ